MPWEIVESRKNAGAITEALTTLEDENTDSETGDTIDLQNFQIVNMGTDRVGILVTYEEVSGS